MEGKENNGIEVSELAEKKFAVLEKISSPLIQMMKVVTDVTLPFVSSAYRGAFLLNGAAAIAVLSKKDTLDDIGKIIVINGAKGASAAVLASFFMYLSQFYSAQSLINSLCTNVNSLFGECKHDKNTGKTPIRTYITGITSYVLFFISLYYFWKSLNSLVYLL